MLGVRRSGAGPVPRLWGAAGWGPHFYEKRGGLDCGRGSRWCVCVCGSAPFLDEWETTKPPNQQPTKELDNHHLGKGTLSCGFTGKPRGKQQFFGVPRQASQDCAPQKGHIKIADPSEVFNICGLLNMSSFPFGFPLHPTKDQLLFLVVWFGGLVVWQTTAPPSAFRAFRDTDAPTRAEAFSLRLKKEIELLMAFASGKTCHVRHGGCICFKHGAVKHGSFCRH